MSNSRCFPEWSLSIGCHIELCTQTYIHGLRKVPNSTCTTSSVHSILFFIFKVVPPSSTWVLQLITNLTTCNESMKTRYPYGNEGCYIHEALEKVASESLHSKNFAPIICLIPLKSALSALYIHSRDVNLFPSM